MNIFILDLDFQRNAEYHVDSHVVKMPTEAAQILGTVYRLTHGELTEVYEVHQDGVSTTRKDFWLIPSDEVKLKGGKLYLLRKTVMAVSHANHPCTRWAAQSKANWLWLRNYALALNTEWKYRYGHTRNHLAINRIIQTPVPNISDEGLTPFVQAMPDEYKDDNAVTAYRNYYRYAKAHLHTFKKRSFPDWLKEA